MTKKVDIQYEEELEAVAKLRLLDDDLMTIVFDRNIEATELLLNIILQRNDLKVTEVTAQREYKNPMAGGRSITIDIGAVDADGKVYDVEVQRASTGADVHRARFHSSMIDTKMLKEKQQFKEIHDSYVIFIVEHDVMGAGLALYHIDRMIKETGECFNDGSHIIYANGNYKNDDDPIGKLMHDFRCINSVDMFYPILADQVKYLAGNDEPEFIFLHKIGNSTMPLEYFSIGEMMRGYEKAGEYFDTVTNKWNEEVFRILSMLRIAQEGNIEVANKIYVMKANYKCNNIEQRKISCQDNPISVYEDLYEWDNQNLAFFRDMAGLPESFIVLLTDVMERFSRGYSASRYDDAYKNLVTLCEIILIGYNSGDKEGGKKEKFANRLAAAIAEDTNVQAMHDKAIGMYKERSNETHEGNNLNISKEELKELRCAVRKLIQNFIIFGKKQYSSVSDKTFKGIKREYVKDLLRHIDALRSKGLLV